ncbi:hypothetical protein [Brevundimonas sp.]|jgi:hypothetical protein|uniref:hypothetical protein n=1 Tax=Brevundimonas sp. TaxID=1871086 RepID=UPI003783661B
MYVLKKAETLEEKLLVLKTMGKAGQDTSDHVWGFWEKDICVGGINLYNLNNFMATENFSIEITVPPSFALGLLGYSALVEALKVKSRLLAKVSIDNHTSRKGARQLGFKKLYVKNGFEFLELNSITDSMHKRWGKYVQGNS